MSISTNQWLTVAEVAQRFGITIRSVRSYISEGLLPAHKIGPRLLRVREADLDQLTQRVDIDAEASRVQALRAYVHSVVKTWPELDPETRDEVRDILRPIVNRVAAPRRRGGG